MLGTLFKATTLYRNRIVLSFKDSPRKPLGELVKFIGYVTLDTWSNLIAYMVNFLLVPPQTIYLISTVVVKKLGFLP